MHFFNRCRGKLSHLSSTLSVFLTSDGEHVLLLDGGVQLQRELRRGAQERLDDGGAFEGVPVHGQDALRLANLPLHGRALAPLQADLPGDGHIGLLLRARLEVDHEGLCAPADTAEGGSGGECRYTFLPTEGGARLHLQNDTTACIYALSPSVLSFKLHKMQLQTT